MAPPTGDVVVIPAGVGHKGIEASPNLGRGNPGKETHPALSVAAIPVPSEGEPDNGEG